MTELHKSRSRRIAVLALLPTLVLAGAWRSMPARQDAPQARLYASLSGREVFLIQGEDTLMHYPVAVGAPKHPTPTGRFVVRRIVWNPGWVPPDEPWAAGKTAKPPGHPKNPMKVVKIFFREPDYYIHGTGDVESLGKAASHGCLRMDPDQAAELAAKVMELGGTTHGWDWIKRVLHLGEERAVSLGRPLPMTIES